MKLAGQQHDLNPHVVLVDGAQGGQSAVETSDPRTNFWKVVDQRMKAAMSPISRCRRCGCSR